MTNKGHRAFSRYRKYGEKQDLEHAIEQFEHALTICPLDHPCYATAQSNMAMAELIRYRVHDTDASFNVPLMLYRNVLTARPAGHPDRPSTLIQLAVVHLARFERRRDEADAAQAEAFLHEVMDLSSGESREKWAAIFILRLHAGRATGGVRVGGQSSMEQDSASGLTDVDPWNSSLQLLRHFQRFGDLADLQQAILILEASIRSTSVSDHRYLIGLRRLGAALWYRFGHLGELSDLEEAISRQQDAVYLSPDGHSNKPSHLSNLGILFRTRFERLGELSDLEEAISRQLDAVDLTPDGHPDKPSRLNNLGNSFLCRFQHLGELSDLEEAISRQQNAVILTPDDHYDKPSRLTNLGSSFRTRFERLGELSDLEEAISRQLDAVELTPDGHPDKPTHLNNLGNSLLSRFRRLGELSDLEEAISRQQSAVNLTPDGHPKKPSCLTNLGNSFVDRFDCLGDLSDLEEAISRQRDALDLIPDGHLHKPIYLNNFGTSFLTRFKCLGELSDIEEAISRLRDAVDLTPDGHPDKPSRLTNLGISFLGRFERLGDLSDLEEAISRQRNTVDLTPDGHPSKPARLNSLGDSFRTRFKRLGELSDLEQAVSVYSHATCDPAGPVADRFRASQSWISCARLLRHQSLLHACSISVGLLPQLAWIGLSLAHRYRELIQGADVVCKAAASALDSGRPETAVEWLEQGRSIVWGELFQLRSSYDELSSAHPDHARRLRELSTALEHASATREKFLSSRLEQVHSAEHRAMESLQREADRHRRLAIGRDKLLQDIRKLPGFERFLLHKEFSQLRASAHSGPVVILNAAETRCDALIVLADVDHVIHVPLPNFTLEQSQDLQTSLNSFVRRVRVIPHDGRYGQPIPQEGGGQWKSILSTLWKCVVKPVLDALAFPVRDTLT